jgi:hypothetical protein
MKNILLILLFLFSLFSSSIALVLRVPSEYPTIQAGINAAIDGDTVLVAPGTYAGTGNRNIDFLGKGILVTSELGPDSTVIDGAGFVVSGFTFHNDETYSSILKGFTITQFSSAIAIYASSPIIINCKLLYCGGHFYSDGAGINMTYSSPIVTNCSIVECYTGQGMGAAILATNSNPVIYNALFYLNVDSYLDPIIICDNGASFINCSFVNNYGGDAIDGSPVIINCIFWGNSGGDIYGDAIVRYSNIEQGWPGPGNISEDPLIVDPENNDFGLLPDSPCIDTGHPRFPNVPWGGLRRDMGAFEFDQGFYFDGQNLIRKPVPVEFPVTQ